MFAERSLPDDVATLRDVHAPDALVLDCETDFETLPQHALDDVATRADSLHPLDYDPDWLPADAPALLERLAGSDLIIGMPGDGSIVWTTQTSPPTVVVKPRVQGSPDAFVDFLLAEALVEVGLGLPEHFLGFFGEHYRDFASATGLEPNATYQLASAVFDAYRGRHTHDVFANWADDHTRLYDAWVDAGERLVPRLDDLSREVSRGETSFPDAAELACSAVKHDVDVPTPFEPLDTLAYEQHGADFAVTWVEKLFE